MAIVVITDNNTLKAGIDSIIYCLPGNHSRPVNNFYIIDCHSFSFPFDIGKTQPSDCFILFYKSQAELNVLHHLYNFCNAFFISLNQKISQIIQVIHYILSFDKKHNSEDGYQPAFRNSVLSGQELKVLHLYINGVTNKEISRVLRVKEKSVLNYRKNSLNKLGIKINARNLNVLRVLLEQPEFKAELFSSNKENIALNSLCLRTTSRHTTSPLV